MRLEVTARLYSLWLHSPWRPLPPTPTDPSPSPNPEQVVRALSIPPLAAPLSAFLARFLDSRDGGTLVLTHLYLLLGCAVPLWLADALPGIHPLPGAGAGAGAAAGAGAGAGAPARSVALDVAPFAGVVVLGMGDAVASVVGIHLGRCRWPGTRKTVEGTAAAAASMLLLLLLLRRLLQGGHAEWLGPASDWWAAALCTALVCLLEAWTSQIDNLFLPIYYCAVLLLVDLR